MFAKIMRIVAKWYGNPTDANVTPQVFDDAIHAWKTGEFEGVAVFQAPDLETGWRMVGGTVQSEVPFQKKGVDQSANDPEKLGIGADRSESTCRASAENEG
jgi:hypothetical protein